MCKKAKWWIIHNGKWRRRCLSIMHFRHAFDWVRGFSTAKNCVKQNFSDWNTVGEILVGYSIRCDDWFVTDSPVQTVEKSISFVGEKFPIHSSFCTCLCSIKQNVLSCEMRERKCCFHGGVDGWNNFCSFCCWGCELNEHSENQ